MGYLSGPPHKKKSNKLNEQKVADIRTAHYWLLVDLAEKYKVSFATIELVVKGKIWKRVPPNRRER